MPHPRRCVCPGSYDPVTNGHLDVISRATALFDDVVVAIVHNPAKHGTFAVPERIELVTDALAARGVTGVQVKAYGGRLLVDVCRELGAVAIVKGLRDPVDLAYERPMAVMNRALSGVETVFLAADPAFEHVSSSLIREIAAYGGDIASFVPDGVRRRLAELRAARLAAEGS